MSPFRKPFPLPRPSRLPGFSAPTRSFPGSVLALLAMLAPLALLPAPSAASKAPHEDTLAAPAVDSAMARLYEEEGKLQYRTGEIKLKDDLAILRLPPGYRYLDEAQTEKVLTEMWGNPSGSGTLGMILAPGMSPLAVDSWAVIVEYSDDGYVKDDDADKIKYDDLLKDMQKATEEANPEREKGGYSAMHLVGWAEKPYYDKEAHKLHWAKELSIEGGKENSLNYNIRILGRKGVLVLNAVSSMSVFPAVKEGVKPILAAVDFQGGHKYSEFDPKLDKVATYGIGGLVAGGILAKVGFFKLLLVGLLALKKFLIIGVIALVALVKRFFKGPAEQKEVSDMVREIPEEKKDSAKT
ncbi:MAG: hypothetical protein JWP91_1254 [Fibrobacteres bacterium]|nr:hypothetical protein [Fibrobacterota bacterium]